MQGVQYIQYGVEQEEEKKKKKRRSTSRRPSNDSARGSPASRRCPRRPRVIFLPMRERVRGDVIGTWRIARYWAVPPKIELAVDFGCRRSIEEEIDRRRSIEQEKGKKKRRRKNTSLARRRCLRVAHARGRFFSRTGRKIERR
ncbi:hypothetical protein BHE74_00025494, partial [Ensete ventricosum]